MQEDNQDHEVGEQQQVDIRTEAQQQHFDEEQNEERKEEPKSQRGQARVGQKRIAAQSPAALRKSLRLNEEDEEEKEEPINTAKTFEQRRQQHIEATKHTA